MTVVTRITREEDILHVHMLGYAQAEESDVVKLDLSNYTLQNGHAAKKLKLWEINYNTDYTYILLKADRTTDFVFAVLSAEHSNRDYYKVGGIEDTETGGTGDLILTTEGGLSPTLNYDISCIFELL